MMRTFLSFAVTASYIIPNVFTAILPAKMERRESVVKPKVFIISMFDPEGEAWYGIPEFDVLAMNITVPGASPLYPQAHCTADGDVCQITIGESGMQFCN